MRRMAAEGRDFSWFDQSRRAWHRLLTLTSAYEETLVAKYAEVDTVCAANYLGLDGVDPNAVHRLFTERFKVFREAMLPWLVRQSHETTDMTDKLAQWYAVFAPDAEVEGG